MKGNLCENFLPNIDILRRITKEYYPVSFFRKNSFESSNNKMILFSVSRISKMNMVKGG